MFIYLTCLKFVQLIVNQQQAMDFHKCGQVETWPTEPVATGLACMQWSIEKIIIDVVVNRVHINKSQHAQYINQQLTIIITYNKIRLTFRYTIWFRWRNRGDTNQLMVLQLCILNSENVQCKVYCTLRNCNKIWKSICSVKINGCADLCSFISYKIKITNMTIMLLLLSFLNALKIFEYMHT